MHYFITGTAGFIGFHLALRLLRQGHSVVGFDGMTAYYDVRLKELRHSILQQFSGFTPAIGMLEDHKALEKAAAIAPPDALIHLAAQAGVRYSLDNPAAYISSNLNGSWNVLELARQLKPAHLLLASTSSVYGANETIPFAEKDRADEPLTLYAATKKSMEVMAHSYAHLHKIPTTAFRFFTVYGPYGRPDMALFKFVASILEGKPLDVYGAGNMSRDFTYVDDLIDSIVDLIALAPDETNRVAGLDTLSLQAPFRTVNIGGGQPVGLLDFIKTIETIMQCKAKRNMLPMQQGDVPRTFASPDLLVALTGKKPATSLQTGVKAFVEWYRDYHSKHEG